MSTSKSRRDSARTRELLLQSASELFTARGFDRTTVREIGERAGVDPALIARYFGSKSQLFIATLRAETRGTVPADLLDPNRLRTMLERVGQGGAGPVIQAAVRPHDDPEAQHAERAELHARLVAPLRERFDRHGADQPQLRAEMAVAAFVGLLLGRNSGAFTHLAHADPDELVPLMQAMLSGGHLTPEHDPLS